MRCIVEIEPIVNENEIGMRNDFVESLWIGGCIGLVVLVVHAFTASATPQVQLLALLVAAVVIACCQIVFTIWRERRGIPSGAPPTDQAPNVLRLRRNRRNPFFRELTSDWTGLDEHLADDDSAAHPSRAGRSEDQSGPHTDDLSR